MRNSGPQSRWTGNNLFVKDTAAALGALREQVGALEREDGALREELKARSNDVRDCEKGVRDARVRFCPSSHVN
jgi:hypothetical protein